MYCFVRGGTEDFGQTREKYKIGFFWGAYVNQNDTWYFISQHFFQTAYICMYNSELSFHFFASIYLFARVLHSMSNDIHWIFKIVIEKILLF